MAEAATLWKMPPIAKIYEALGVVADGRVEEASSGIAYVTSSQGDKRYTVEISVDGRGITSNDNASYWQGYLGYPAIAVLVRRGMYAPRQEVLRALARVPWKEINRRNRNDWAKTIAQVEQRAAQAGHDVGVIRSEAEAILQALENLAPYRTRRIRPPAEKSSGRPPTG